MWSTFLSGTIIACLAMSNVAHAAAMTVGDLKDFCTATDAKSRVACRFFIYGVVQGIGLSAGKLGDTELFCLPDSLSMAAMESTVKLAIEQDLAFFPKDSGLEASGFVGAAMMMAFPCQEEDRR
jgi:hypothetical protein